MNHGESKEIKRNTRIMLWNIEGLKNATSTIATDFLEGYDAESSQKHFSLTNDNTQNTTAHIY